MKGHPDYGITRELRLQVAKFANLTSVQRAVEEFGFCDQSVRNWLKFYREDLA